MHNRLRGWHNDGMKAGKQKTDSHMARICFQFLLQLFKILVYVKNVIEPMKGRNKSFLMEVAYVVAAPCKVRA